MAMEVRGGEVMIEVIIFGEDDIRIAYLRLRSAMA